MKSSIKVVSPVDLQPFAAREYVDDSAIPLLISQARGAQQDWADTPIAARTGICRRFVDALEKQSAELREELTLAIGRPCVHTAGELNGVRERATWLIDIAAQALEARELRAPAGITAHVSRVPCGIVLLVVPWNYPYLTAINSLIPALMAGNAVIIKHSPQTPMIAERIVQAFDEAGAAPHVVNFMHCNDNQTRKLISDRSVDHVVFTGSVAVGRLIAGIAGGALVGCTLELGGKDAAYVRDDAEPETTAAALADGAFFNAGQSCCAIERIYVHRNVYSDFVDAFVREASKWRLGDPRESDTTLGPVISEAAADRVRAQVQQAISRGAELAQPKTSSRSRLRPANYLEPQILTSVDHSMDIMRHETFGPAVGILSVDSDDEAVRMMNDSEFGLTGSIWTDDVDAAGRIGSMLDTGTWFMNRCDYVAPYLPWSGRKDSGLGCSLGESGYLEVTRPRSALLRGNRRHP